MFIIALISLFLNQDKFLLILKEANQISIFQFINIQALELDYLCLIMIAPLNHSPMLASNMPSAETILSIWPQKILFLRSMTADSKISSKTFIKQHIKNNFKPKNYGMNTDWSTIWSLKSLKDKEDMYGPARTMMVMFNQISLPKVMDLLD